jgi:hypothetical protein
VLLGAADAPPAVADPLPALPVGTDGAALVAEGADALLPLGVADALLPKIELMIFPKMLIICSLVDEEWLLLETQG